MDHTIWSRVWHAAATVFIATVLTACGGGGGSGQTTQLPPPTLSQDTLPAGNRTGGPANLFPLAAGDSATYRKLDASGVQVGTVTRVVSAGTAGSGSVVVTETDSADPFDPVSSSYTKSTAGLTLNVANDPSLPAAVASAIGSILEYPDPMYPIGGVRTSLRQGSWGGDLNGDGVPEGFRFTFVQIFRGFESLTFSGNAISVARFSNTATVTLISSNPADPPISILTTEESFLTGDFGMVRSVREVREAGGLVLEPQHTLEINDATVGGRSWTAYLSPAGSAVLSIPLLHNALVFDPGRGVYYASVPNSSTSNPNSIATVNAVSGTTSFTAPLALDPGALGISADGSTLYVYANNHLIRLALPALTETGRVALPPSTFCGSNTAERIAVSPTDANAVAVSLANAGCSPRHEGVVLYRNLVEQPNRTQTHTGSNEIVFAPSGTELFGLNTETSEWGLRRVSVLGDGLTQTAVVAANGNYGLNWRTLDASATYIVLGDAIHQTSNLARLGALPGQSCRLASPRIVCLGAPVSGTSILSELVIVVDPATQLPISSLRFGASDYVTGAMRVTPGPAGRVAISSTDLTASLPFRTLKLFENAALP